MIGLGQAVSFIGTLLHWNGSADPYSSLKYLFFATAVLSWSLTHNPRRGLLSVVAIIYMATLTFFSLVAFRQVCFIGHQLSYFTGVIPSFLVFACYHYSIGEKWEKSADALIASCCLISVVCLFQMYGLFMPQGDFFSGRAYFAVGSPVFLSGVLAMAIPLCLGRGRIGMAIPLLATAILSTQSRSGILAAAVGVLGYYFAKSILGIKGLIILCVIALAVTVGMFASIRPTGASDRGRYQMFRIAAISIAENPIFGVGPERFAWAIKRYRDDEFNSKTAPTFTNAYVHNHILEALVAGGPVFLVVHLLLIGTIGLFAYRVATPPVFGAAMALCAFGLMQPTPLVMKAVLASILGALDPSEREYPRRPFILIAFIAFFAALSTVTMARIYKTAVDLGLAQMAMDSYKYTPSALGPNE